MQKPAETSRIVRVFRYDPTRGQEGHYDRFEVPIKDPRLTTILDVLMKIQSEQDPSLAFRFACRVSMCGSCGMVINGRERLACKTVVAQLKEKEITVRPLSHFPVVKDLVVDMEPFFEKYKAALPFFDPAEDTDEPAVIPPDSKERREIGLSTECIACGCCVSSCSMASHHDAYCGPAAINRAFTLIADSRDGLRQARLDAVLESCYHCRTELNCTEVCPKEISPTRAIKYIQKQACLDALQPKSKGAAVPEIAPSTPPPADHEAEPPRRRFLKRITYGLGTATAAIVGGVLASSAVAPALRGSASQWVAAGGLDDFNPGKVTTVYLHYEVQDGFYHSRKVAPVLVSRSPDGRRIVVFSSNCTHLGCTVRWDEDKQLFLCACHGGAFAPDGSVKSGPPPRPLDRRAYKIADGALLVEVA